jgi:5'-nucleotidase
MTDQQQSLVVAISSRALFDFEEENRVFQDSNDIEYMKLQMERLDVPALPGVAFQLVKKLLAFNTPDQLTVSLAILSRNDPVSGMRVVRSAKHYGLDVERCVFTRGAPPWKYLGSIHADLFLSAHDTDVRDALNSGFPAARVLVHSAKASQEHPKEVRIAFDGDAVLFSDEAERVYQSEGLDAFRRHEVSRAHIPLPPGPFKPLLQTLHKLQKENRSQMKLRTALVTARVSPSHERAIRTLMSWNVDIDEAFFLGGLDKGPFLRDYEPDFFFDDQTRHCESVSAVAPAGHVAGGIVNASKPR